MNGYIAYELGVPVEENVPRAPQETFPELTAEFLLRVVTGKRFGEEVIIAAVEG